MSRNSIFKEYFTFLRQEKKYWMIPVFVLLFIIGLLVVFFESSAIAPFIYAIF